MTETLPYVEQYGLQSEETYPYTWLKTLPVVITPPKSLPELTTTFRFQQKIESALLEAVAEVGPVSVAINAAYISSYASGVFEEAEYSPEDLDHGVLVIGYGT
ncbi:unnamed protein product [Ceutorhynchus assimilis]|uniref:Peptidase C1A papain C-terminal domain-containing protein n=1 Tax=Ceutorhynchus assimilis TaxID=467358 RepID=A0A9N9QKP7_9CUCU|nr:unnamed protein product [Ceutorhynchus assimilis]